jgi:hypothetical protein
MYSLLIQEDYLRAEPKLHLSAVMEHGVDCRISCLVTSGHSERAETTCGEVYDITAMFSFPSHVAVVLWTSAGPERKQKQSLQTLGALHFSVVLH